MDREFAYSFKEYQKTGNFWCDLNPITKLIVSFMVALSTIVINDWRYGLPVCVFYVIFAVFTGKFKEFIKLYAVVLFTIVFFSLIVRQIGSRSTNITPMFEIFGWTWYLETFYASLTLISYIVGFAGAVLIFFTTTEMRDIMFSLEQLGVSHVTSFIMLSSMQNIIDLRKASITILESQKSRGIETDGNFLVRTKAFFPTLGPLMLGAMSGTEEKSIAMDARAFSVDRKHTFLREIAPMSKGQKLLVILSVLYLLACIAFRVLKAVGII